MKDKKTKFKIVYDGDALRGGQIDVRVLAPALLAFGDLLEEANQIVYQGQSSIKLYIKKDSEIGSFPTLLEIARTLHQQFVSIFSGDEVNAWKTFLEIVDLSGDKGIFHILKHGKGKKPKKVVEIKETNTVRIEFDDEFPIEVVKQAYDLYKNPKARRAAAEVISPLKNEGVDKFSLISGGKEMLDVNKQETEFFSMSETDQEENIAEAEMFLSIVSVSFKENLKWRFSDGEVQYNATILDEDFKKRVDNNEPFCKDDQLKVTLRTRQKIIVGEIKTEHEIVKVLKHTKAPQQNNFSFKEK